MALRRAILITFFSSCLVILLGSGLNHLGHKYTRVIKQTAGGSKTGFTGSAAQELVLNELAIEPGVSIPLRKDTIANTIFTTSAPSSSSNGKNNVYSEHFSNTTVNSIKTMGSGKGRVRRNLKASPSSGSSGSGSGSSVGGTTTTTTTTNTTSTTSTMTPPAHHGNATSITPVDPAAAALSGPVGARATVCRREVLAINVPNSNMCCDTSLRGSDWVCVAAYDRFNKVLSSSWAYLIPLVPWALSAASSLSDTNTSLAHAKRLCLYAVIFLVRMLVLYKAMGWVQSSLQPLPGGDCWYAPYTRHNACLGEQFDFSDHIVLYVANYLAPAAVEVAYAHTNLASTGGGTWLRYSPAVGSAFIMGLVTLRGILFTCMFFHSPLESLVGLGVVSLGVLLPLWVLAESSFWHSACISTLAKT